MKTLLALLCGLCLATAAISAAAAPRPKVGLVLGGGGARGAAHIGVLETLERLQVPVDCVAGTSFGALVAGAWAAGRSGRVAPVTTVGRGAGAADRSTRVLPVRAGAAAPAGRVVVPVAGECGAPCEQGECRGHGHKFQFHWTDSLCSLGFMCVVHRRESIGGVPWPGA